MRKGFRIPQKLTALLVYGRPPLVFGGMLCALAVMWSRNPNLYALGLFLLFISMLFDLVDGWFAERFRVHSMMAHLADRVTDKVVFSIIFPLVSVGVMWRLAFVSLSPTKSDLLHAIFVLILCVTVMIRDNFAHFVRFFALRTGVEPEPSEFTRLRTVVAAPVGLLLYAHAFYIPEGPSSAFYMGFSWLGNIPLRTLFLIEIAFLIINFGSIALYCRKYGANCLDEICDEDERLRRRILSFFPNTLTVLNALMGLLAVFFAYQDNMRESYLFLIGAALFDKLDGALARRLGLAEDVPAAGIGRRPSSGALLDDFSDAVSFCVAPAWIFFICHTGAPEPAISRLLAGIIAVAYACMGIARLVYFTLDRSPVPGFFKGMPTPAAALLVVAPLTLYAPGAAQGLESAPFWGLVSAVVMVVASCAMNLYPVRYVHGGRAMGQHPWTARIGMAFMLMVLLTPYFGHVAFAIMLAYLVSPIWSRPRPHERAVNEAKA